MTILFFIKRTLLRWFKKSIEDWKNAVNDAIDYRYH
jgi:hypothetical protein